MMKNNQNSAQTDTSVSHDAHKCLIQQTLVSDTTNTSVYQSPLSASRVCACCGRLLATSDFYMRNRQRTPDSYCKECRKAASRLRRKSKTDPSVADKDHPAHSVITRIEEREVRLKLIMQALQTVHESVARQQKKTHEKEFRKEWNNPLSFSEIH